MTGTLIDGKAVAERIRARVADDVRALGAVGLTTVLVGHAAASDIYIRLKHKAATEAGMTAVDLRLPASTREDDVLAKVGELNADPSVHGLLVQLPLPAGIDEQRVIQAIDPLKDVDGLNRANAGDLFQGRPGLVAATARGVLALLNAYEIELDGAEAVV